MLFATAGQGALFIWMMAAGVIMALWYGFTALLRHLLPGKWPWMLFCDLIFGAGAAAIFCAALVLGNYGRMRLFALIALLLGAASAFLGLGGAMRRLEQRLSRTFRRIMTVLYGNRLIKVIFK